MAGMRTRALVSVAAWLAGLVAATSGTIVAVSLIGQGINTSPIRTLSVNDVNSALAGISQAPDSSVASASPSPTDTPSSAEPSPSPSRSASPHASASTAPPPVPRTLTSKGGSVIAVCTSAGAYLSSWSPAQGYQVADVHRGPSNVAGVEFQQGLTQVELRVVCQSGVPVASHDE